MVAMEATVTPQEIAGYREQVRLAEQALDQAKSISQSWCAGNRTIRETELRVAALKAILAEMESYKLP
jgi:hypothetical protein